MSSKRRRWLTVLGFLLTTVAGAVLSYLLSRRARWARERSPEEASVPELSARLRRKASLQEKRLRRERSGIPWLPAWFSRRSLRPSDRDSSEVDTLDLDEGP
jgi:hypothetical protein